MPIAEFLRRYDEEVRLQPVARSGLDVEDDGLVVCLVGSFNFICSWRFGAADARSVVDARVRRFRALIWRVHEHDGPENLGIHLAACGFEPALPGTLMFVDLHDAESSAVPGVSVRRVSTAEDLIAFLAASDVAFGERRADGLYQPYLQRMRDPTFALFVAYVEEAPVGAARLEWNGCFGQLYGGGVRPEHRGRGVYRALCDACVEEARHQRL